MIRASDKQTVDPNQAGVDAIAFDPARFDPSRVEREANERIAQSGQFRGRVAEFNFRAHNGVLFVTGRVPSFYLKQTIQAALQGIHGVERIVNCVDVVSSNGLSSVDKPGSPKPKLMRSDTPRHNLGDNAWQG